MRHVILAALLTAAAGSAVNAGIEFKQTTCRKKTGPGQRQIECTYTFTNTGKQTVRITAVQSSCGCTTTTLEKRAYAPGETGTIEATMTVSDAPGKVSKLIYVSTDAPGGPRHKLTITAVVPEYVRLSPAYLKWVHKAQPEPRVVTATVTYEDAPMQIVGVECSDDDWQAELQTTEKKNVVRIVVTPPRDTATPSRNKVSRKTDYPAGNPMSIPLITRVMHERKRPRRNWMLELMR